MDIKELKEFTGYSISELAYRMGVNKKTLQNKMYNPDLLIDRDKMMIELIRENYLLKNKLDDRS